MRKLLFISLAMFLAPAMLFAAPSDLVRINVGVSTPLSGYSATSGVDTRNALTFANQHFFDNRYHFVFEDDRCDPMTGVTAANTLTRVHKIKYVLGVFCNNVLIPAAKIYSQNKTLVIAAGATSGDINDIGANIFRPYPADQYAAVLLARYIRKNHKRIGIITELDEYAALMERHFLETLKNENPEIEIFIEQVPPSTRDYRPVVLRLKQKNIDALFMNAMGEPGLIEIVKAVKQFGLTAERYANLLPASPTVQDALGELNEGMKFSNFPLLESLLSPLGKETYQLFEARFGKPQSVPLFIPLVMDSLRLLDAALQSGKDPGQYLYDVEFPGLMGPIKFDQYGAISSIQYEMQEIRKGRPVKLDS